MKTQEIENLTKESILLNSIFGIFYEVKEINLQDSKILLVNIFDEDENDILYVSRNDLLADSWRFSGEQTKC